MFKWLTKLFDSTCEPDKEILFQPEPTIITKETTMSKGPVNQHKRMAMGEKVSGMKKGGAVKGTKPADKPVKGGTPKGVGKNTVKKGK